MSGFTVMGCHLLIPMDLRYDHLFLAKHTSYFLVLVRGQKDDH